MEALTVLACSTSKCAFKTEHGSKPVHNSKDDLVCTYCERQRHTENKCFKKAKDLNLQAKKSQTKPQQTRTTVIDPPIPTLTTSHTIVLTHEDDKQT